MILDKINILLKIKKKQWITYYCYYFSNNQIYMYVCIYLPEGRHGLNHAMKFFVNRPKRETERPKGEKT